ncbi:hypothetical protein [Sedimentitalea nanhaiensis]|uniref:hypothetical protein n=1 Tax=Sedimentitalea nanhaiensis TaxID=999627 RepID=UPI00042627CB|nr:hypothetical protein [Sedimentitalea nanhaiensis]
MHAPVDLFGLDPDPRIARPPTRKRISDFVRKPRHIRKEDAEELMVAGSSAV